MKPIALLLGALLPILSLDGLCAQSATANNQIGQVADGSYQYVLYSATAKAPWTIVRLDLNGSSDQHPKLIYSGKNPFKPEPSSELRSTLGTQNLTSLVSQWVSGVLGNGKDAVTADFLAYYKANGKPKYTGLSAQVFRQQGVDPEAPPKDNW